MKYNDDYEYDDGGGGLPVMYMALIVSLFILAVVGIVVYANRNNSGKNYKKYVASMTTVEEEESTVTHKRTADELDIWDMYPENSSNPESEAETSYDTDKPEPTPEVSPVSDDEKYNDGEHFKIDLSDGTSEWIKIDSSLKLNNYDFMNLKASDGKLKYYDGDKVISFVGVDVSRYQKDIDFAQVKNSGIDFVMIRVGARGYQTGVIAIDEYFETNIKNATESGLDVGVYFYSQAITTAEATEEANTVIQSLNNYKDKIKYPVAFYMEPVENDMARIDSLSKDERQVIAATFLNTVAAAGYKTLLYGDEEWLVKKIDLKNFPTTSFWLSDMSDMPDYPYQFSMWQYTKTGSVVGINGDVNMDICFIDYSAQ